MQGLQQKSDAADSVEEEDEEESLSDTEPQRKQALYPRLLVDPAHGHHHYIFLNSVPGMILLIERWPNRLDIQATYKVKVPLAEDWTNSMPQEHKQCITFPNQETRSFFESVREQQFVLEAPDGTELVETTTLGPNDLWKVVTFKMHPSQVGDSGMITL